MLRWITDFTYKIECRAAEAGHVYRLASRYYRDVVEKEATLAGITGDDHVLCIGGGICPFSAILFHEVTGARVTVIDNNMVCIPKARQVIDRLELGEHVRVLCREGGGAGLRLSDYSVVHLALQVHPMENVFAGVERQVLPGTRLLVRRPRKHLCGMYDRLTDPVLSCHPYVAHKNARNIGSTLLYVKQERPHDRKKNTDRAADPAFTDCAIPA